ncbi:hypothetical protein [Natronoarchaeum philippinense]|uniref:hypothetical protein n=1 Tax=Natronoarchaeum philippinense TaxID=558529 RepID=UPI00117CB2BD|nr:hypothetical protein [Natronoarchaeum philippinense]
MSEAGVGHIPLPYIDTSKDTCPVCGREFNATFSTVGSKLTAPDEGDWCIYNGVFIIHEELKYWDSNSNGGDS